jgi:RNA polymerase sigma-70 factor (ECF subfamily)
LKDYRPGQKLSNWLYTIALNECRKQLRRRRIVRFFSLGEGNPIEAESPGPGADRKVAQDRSRQLLEKLVADLPPSLRTPFVLRYFEELNDEEIAQVTGLSLSNVRVRIHRARHYLWEKHGKLIKEIL